MASEALEGAQQSHWDQAFRSDAVQNPIVGKLFWTRVLPTPFISSAKGEGIPCLNRKTVADTFVPLLVSIPGVKAI